MTIAFVLFNGRTGCVCGVFSSNAIASHYAVVHGIDSWHVFEYVVDAQPVRYA